MIAYLEGKIAHIDPAHVIIDVGGVGYELRIPLNTYSKLKGKERTRIHTHLHIKEDAHTLYGFAEPSEKDVFLHLISISGVGPGTALMVLSSLSPDEIKTAIARQDVATIQRVKGIGTKTAQRIILELKDKLAKMSGDPVFGEILNDSSFNIREEAIAALITLGINKAQAEKSIASILKNADKPLSLEDLIKLALKSV
jgi:Holliday junction DNA helicase RuvA